MCKYTYMKIVDMANEIFLNLGSPTYTSIPFIAFWIRSKVATINNLLFEDFFINPQTLEILNLDNSEIAPEAVAIIQQMYKVYDYEVQIRSMMNAMAADSVVKFDDQNTSVVRINKNEIAKTLNNIRKDEIKYLDVLVNAYRSRTAQPSQIAGDDTEFGYFTPYKGIFVRP